MSALLAAVFLASLLGSLHCAGMCGPLVALAVSDNPSLAPRGLAHLMPHAAYHAARLAVYVVLGALFGLLGSALDRGAALADVRHAAALLSGATLIGVGALACLRALAVPIPQAGVPAWIGAGLAAGHRLAAGFDPLPRAGTIGLLTALLPCGWLYGFLLVAAGSGGAGRGAAIMLVFWLGTVPILTGLGLAAQCMGRLAGARVQLAASLMLIFLGVLTAWGRLGAWDALSPSYASKAESPEALAGQVARMHSADADCCREKP